ncbi:MAG TPA: sugar transferase [Acidimicrobiales bacterium]|nr:sugar transferase [Acidimicrobiales bacterium]
MASDAQSLPFQSTASTTLAPVEPVPLRPDSLVRSRAADQAPSRSLLRTRLFVVDVLAVTLSWIPVGFALLGGSAANRLAPGAAAAAATLIAMQGIGLYRSRLCVRRGDELWRIFLSSLWGAAAFVVVQWQTSTPGSEVLAAMAACLVLTGTCRWQFARWLRARRADGLYLRNVVLVGANEDAVALHTMLRSEPELGYRVTAVVGARRGDPEWDDVRTAWSLADIPSLAADTGASGILVVPFALSSAATQQALAVAAGADLHIQVWPGFRGVGSGRLRNVPVSGEAFFYVEPKRSARWQLASKRAIDVVGAGFVLLVTSPILAVAALAVKLEDGGPVFYRDERVGLHGEPFRICKLRSMSPNQAPSDTLSALNERTDGPLFKASQDPRVTRVGRLIRASSIDELPQLWNVLLGTMSLVGPRPALPGEVSQFDDDFQRRHSVRPGMTGLWQVEARQNPSFNAYRRLDLRYIDNWSLRLDFTIILTTVPAVISQALRSLLRHSRRSRSSGGEANSVA